MLCFKGRCYKSTDKPHPLEYSRAKTDFFNQEQRLELKRRMLERYLKMFGKDSQTTITQFLDEYFTCGAEINTHNRFILEQRIRNQINAHEAERKAREGVTKSQVVSGVTKSQVVSGVTKSQHEAVDRDRTVQSQEMASQQIGWEGLTEDQIFQVQPIQWKSEEEKWATIYKYNSYVYRQEQKLDKLRALHKQETLKATLEEQMRERERLQQKQREEDISFMVLNKQIKENQRENEELKKRHMSDKIRYHKEMRLKQIQDNRDKREREEQIEKDRQARAKSIIQEELRMERMEAEELKNMKLEEMRRVMQENEERKVILAQVKEKERQEEVAMQKRSAAIAVELERARQAEFKAKADRLSSILKSSEEAVSTMRQKQVDQDYKNRRYQELKDKLLEEKAKRDAQADLRRRDQLKAFLRMQTEEKRNREAEEEAEIQKQGAMWKNQNDQFKAYTAKKQTQKAENYQRYREDLKLQMAHKNKREQEEAALQISADDAKMNQLMFNKVRQLRLEEVRLTKSLAAKRGQTVLESREVFHS